MSTTKARTSYAGTAVSTLALIALIPFAAAQTPSGPGTPAPATPAGQPASATPAGGAAGQPVRRSSFHEPEPLKFDDNQGFTQVFDGKSLDGWEYDPEVWHVENGAIVGISTVEHPHHSFISYKNLTAKDFDLKLEIKVEQGGGSGIQYRSKTGPWHARPQNNPNNPAPTNPNWLLTGPQADFWFPVRPQSEVLQASSIPRTVPWASLRGAEKQLRWARAAHRI